MLAQNPDGDTITAQSVRRVMSGSGSDTRRQQVWVVTPTHFPDTVLLVQDTLLPVQGTLRTRHVPVPVPYYGTTVL
jgi:hypothetical protein